MATNDLKQIDELLQKRLAESESRVMAEVGKFMEDYLFSRIGNLEDGQERLETTVDRIDRKLDRALDTITDHENRVKVIEQVPVVAHDLKQKIAKR